MKEIFKSKVMLLFIIMMLATFYIGSLKTDKLEDNNLEETHKSLVAYVK